ncbi:phosphotransferase [Cedratvirus kamchatka]|uniref:Phosphotransferase n=1 Tax=Cedratvirus kamchatka TaxID=2716914 RepID=A0A6G8MYA0_9VIRU|nr:phosphotransferase [Cedratvirus kamchatka]
MQFIYTKLQSNSDLVFLRTYEDGSKCIVKFIKDKEQNKGEEYRIMKLLSSKGIKVPKVLDYQEVDVVFDNQRFVEMIIMEYIPGDDLRRNFPKEESKRIALQMIDLVGQVNKEGYQHGDLHSGNFIWDGRELTLIDFGAAYKVGDSPDDYYDGVGRDERCLIGCVSVLLGKRIAELRTLLE